MTLVHIPNLWQYRARRSCKMCADRNSLRDESATICRVLIITLPPPEALWVQQSDVKLVVLDNRLESRKNEEAATDFKCNKLFVNLK